MTIYHRPSWDEYFIELTEVVGHRGTCDRGRCGAIAVKDKYVLATGYVGAPAGLPHCDEVGHDLKQVTHADGHVSTHCMRTVHAEQNLICQAAKRGVSMEGATVYTKMTPCRTCAMLLINAGVVKIISLKRYQAEGESIELFRKAGVEIVFVKDEVERY